MCVLRQWTCELSLISIDNFQLSELFSYSIKKTPNVSIERLQLFVNVMLVNAIVIYIVIYIVTYIVM